MKALLMPTLLILLLSSLTIHRNAVWHTPIALWQDVANKNMNRARVHNNLGNCYALAGKSEEAIKEYKEALALDRYYIEAYYNLGVSLEDVGRGYEAVPYYYIYCKDAPLGFRKAVTCERYNELSKK